MNYFSLIMIQLVGLLSCPTTSGPLVAWGRGVYCSFLFLPFFEMCLPFSAMVRRCSGVEGGDTRIEVPKGSERALYEIFYVCGRCRRTKKRLSGIEKNNV
uniref:T. congolense-specific, cell surface-expressed gene family n=1 Tax=Trypanosoma congolense (strain IL3000) TaxID=1068625 RepID=G0URR5_TRYCI|nr:hypothetical protein, unlikely [Trypanosoma congolense IL3000]